MTAIEKIILTFIAAKTDEDRQRAAQEASAYLSLMTNSPPSEKQKPTDKHMEHIVTDIIKDIGIPCHLKGYAYAVTAVTMAVESPDIVHHITKELYPAVAKVHNTTNSRAERAIRHAIDTAVDKGYENRFPHYFGNSVSRDKLKPTNSQFIATIANYIRENM